MDFKKALQVRRWRPSKAPRICGRDRYARTDVTLTLRNRLQQQISPQPHIPPPNLVPEASARVLTSSSHIRRRRRKEKCREINMSNERGLFRLFFLLLLLIRHRSFPDGQDGLGGIGCGIFGAHTQQKKTVLKDFLRGQKKIIFFVFELHLFEAFLFYMCRCVWVGNGLFGRRRPHAQLPRGLLLLFRHCRGKRGLGGEEGRKEK